jgi:glucosamine--fructose-6-phosphate aminotransferase (isomerizing)
VGSSIARETDAGCYLHVGPEIGVASTKAFTAQVLLLAMLALALAREKGVIDAAQLRARVDDLARLPALVERCLEEAPRVCEVAREYRFASSFLFLGRGANYPVALEGALKLKECSYIHAEGMAAAELKHGPLALVERFMPVVAICPREDPVFDKLRANVEEVLARGGAVLLMTQPGADSRLEARCDAVLSVPAAPEWLAPIVHAVPLQLLAYHLAVRRGCDVDRPRNLAKSVTVE